MTESIAPDVDALADVLTKLDCERRFSVTATSAPLTRN